MCAAQTEAAGALGPPQGDAQVLRTVVGESPQLRCVVYKLSGGENRVGGMPVDGLSHTWQHASASLSPWQLPVLLTFSLSRGRAWLLAPDVVGTLPTGGSNPSLVLFCSELLSMKSNDKCQTQEVCSSLSTIDVDKDGLELGRRGPR